MPPKVLSVVVYGLGEDPRNRSHWAFSIHNADMDTGNLLHVSPVDRPGPVIYLFDSRKDVIIRSQSSEGSFAVANIEAENVNPVTEIIKAEQAPNDGVERCQDWVLRSIISLECEELVPSGTSDWIGELVGLSAAKLAETVGQQWTPTTAQ